MTKPISPLRQRMIDDMTMRNLSANTQETYIRSVAQFSAFHVLIAEQVAWDLIPGEGFGDLLRNPFCRRVGRHIDQHLQRSAAALPDCEISDASTGESQPGATAVGSRAG